MARFSKGTASTWARWSRWRVAQSTATAPYGFYRSLTHHTASSIAPVHLNAGPLLSIAALALILRLAPDASARIP